jgi:sortase A
MGERETRRRFLVLAGTGVVAVGAAAAGWDLSRPSTQRSARPATRVAPTQHLQVRTDAEPALPIPDPLPDPDAPASGIVIGTIGIARLGLMADIQEGMALADIDRGPSHWPATARPGQLGNMVLAGHRTTYTEPFRHLERLQPGDPVEFVVGGVTVTYATRGVVVVPANAVDIAAQNDAHTATLFACHPPGQATERIVAKLRLLDAAGQPVDPDSALPPLDGGSQAGGHVLTVRVDPLG